MTTRLGRRMGLVVATLATIFTLMLTSFGSVTAAPFDGQRLSFADERFSTVWTRTDSADVRGGRSWYWGPNPWFDNAEFYRQGVNGLRTVQYFDKARMEINNPNDRSGSQQGVTNGLLVKELVSGRIQLGNDPYDVDARTPADVPVAGNPRSVNMSGVGYSAFAGVATIDNGYRDPQRTGERISTTLDRGGNLGINKDLARPETEIVQFNSVTGHNIPKVLWDFMNLQGRIAAGGRVTTGPVVDWLFAMGLPITDAYWTRAQVGDTEVDVLVQLFERRVLTYVPTNPVGYQVEMGNVGQHYFQWRYPHLGQPWAAPDANPPLLYASDSSGKNYWDVYMYATTGSVTITSSSAESVVFSYRRSYEPSQFRILIDSRRGNGTNRQIYEVESGYLYGYNPVTSLRRLTYSDGAPIPNEGPYPGWLPNNVAHEYNPSYSPDGTKIAFISDRTGNAEIFMMPANGNNPTQVSNNSCTDEYPTWSPNGRTLYWQSNCDGDFEVMSGDLNYLNDAQWGVSATLVNVKQLTNNQANDRYPRVSPDGKQIAFTSDREGNNEIYVINSADGGGERRLTTNSADDQAPTWAADGQTLAFASNRDGDFEIFTISLKNMTETQLTNNTSQDAWPLWAQ